jgi:hypothetical protein
MSCISFSSRLNWFVIRSGFSPSRWHHVIGLKLRSSEVMEVQATRAHGLCFENNFFQRCLLQERIQN